MRKMKIIGITGGIGCGKSRVCAYLKDKYDAEIISADEVAHEVIEPGTAEHKKLRKLFGNEFFLKDGRLNRKKAGDAAFKNPDILKKMNEIIHPAVLKNIKKNIAAADSNGKPIAIIEAALLVGSKYRKICSEFWYIYADREVRIQRLLASRDITIEKVLYVMDAQNSEEEFKNGCDIVIDNNMDFSLTKEQIDNQLRGSLNL